MSRCGLNRYTVCLTVVLFGVLALASPTFRQLENAANFVNQLTALFLVSLGQMVVVISRGVDLSVGSVMSLASAIVATQSNPVVGVLLALAAAVVVGLVNGAGVAYANMHPLIMTLSTGIFIQGLAFVILPISVATVPEAMRYLASGAFFGVPFSVLWCLAGLLTIDFLTRKTRFGLYLYAVGGHDHSAHLNGIPVKKIYFQSYVICSVLAAVAGIYLTGRVFTGDPILGVEFTMNSLATIALGGILLTGGVGGVAGVLAGAACMGFIANGLNLLGISPFMRGAATGILLLIAVSLQRRRMVGL